MVENVSSGNQARIGVVLLDNPEAKCVYLYLVQLDENNKALNSLGIPAKFLLNYLKENEKKLESKTVEERIQEASKDMMVV